MTRLHRRALEVMVQEIVSGSLAVGDALPRETELAAQFDISRGTAREVIRALEERGLIHVKHGRGATVCPRDSWDVLDADVLAAILASGERSKVLQDFLESRQILEVESAALAAARASKNDIAELQEAFEIMSTAAAAANGSQIAEKVYLEADVRFHSSITRASKNATLIALVERIHGATLAARFPTARPSTRMEQGLPEHRRILDAITAHDVEAARAAMADHLATVAKNLAKETSGRKR